MEPWWTGTFRGRVGGAAWFNFPGNFLLTRNPSILSNLKAEHLFKKKKSVILSISSKDAKAQWKVWGVDVAFAKMVDTRVVHWYQQQLYLILKAQKSPLGDLVSPKRKKVPTKDMGHHNQTKVLRTRTCLPVFVWVALYSLSCTQPSDVSGMSNARLKVSTDCQPDSLWNHKGNKALSMPMREFLHSVSGGEKSHPGCEQHHFTSRSVSWLTRRKWVQCWHPLLSASCPQMHLTSCFMLLLPWQCHCNGP